MIGRKKAQKAQKKSKGGAAVFARSEAFFGDL
jgi:hypothetical protein